MQEAVVHMGSKGGTLLLPAGILETFALTSIYQHVCVMGAGPDATFVNNNSMTSGVFLFQLVNPSTATGGACLANLTISAGSAINTSIAGSNSTAVLANGIGNSKTGMWIHDVIVKNHNIGIDLEGVLYVYLTNFTLLYQNSYGIKLNGSAFIDNGVISNSGATGLPAASDTAGFLWDDGAGLYMHNVDVTAMPNGIMVRPVAGGSVSAGFFDSVLGDTSNAHGWLFDATNGPILQMQLTGCWGGFSGCYSPAILAANLSGSATEITVHPSNSQPYPRGANHLTLENEQIVCENYTAPTFTGCSRGQFGTSAAPHGVNANVFVCKFPGDGLHLQGPPGSIDGIAINGGMWSGNGGSAMHFTSGKNLQVSNALISQNSNYQTLAANEIDVGAGVSDWSVRGSTIGNYATIQTPRAGFGVSVSPGTSDNYAISGNRFVNLGLGPVHDAGTGVHKIIGDNLGIDEQVSSLPSATSFAFPVNPTFKITGTATISSVSGLWAGRRGMFVSEGTVPFIAGATIGNSCTTMPSKLYSYFFDGTKLFIDGSGC
jgi:hypothetical protein